MSLLERFIRDSKMYTAKRNRSSSANEVIDIDIAVPTLSKIRTDSSTDSCLKCSDKIIAICRDFANETAQKCRLIEQVNVPIINEVSLVFFINYKKNFIESIVKAGTLAERELVSLYKSYKKKDEDPEGVKPDVKREISRRSLSTIKKSYEDLTDDDLFLVEDNLLAAEEHNSAVKDEFENIFDQILGCDAGSLNLSVKREFTDDDIFSVSTGIPEADTPKGGDNGTDRSGDTEGANNTDSDELSFDFGAANEVDTNNSYNLGASIKGEDSSANEVKTPPETDSKQEKSSAKETLEGDVVDEVKTQPDSDGLSFDFGAANEVDTNNSYNLGASIKGEDSSNNIANEVKTPPETDNKQEQFPAKETLEGDVVDEVKTQPDTNIKPENSEEKKTDKEVDDEKKTDKEVDDEKKTDKEVDDEKITDEEVVDDEKKTDREVVDDEKKTDKEVVDDEKKTQSVSAEDNCDNLVNNNKVNKPRRIKKRLTKYELREQFRLLNEICDISDMENDISKSDMSLSESEGEYERPAKRPKITEENDENANEIKAVKITKGEGSTCDYSMINPCSVKITTGERSKCDYSMINPCSVKITKEERSTCDDFYYRLIQHFMFGLYQCLKKRSPGPTSEEDSELLVNPLRKRPALFSTTSYTSSDSDADKLIESENKLSIQCLNKRSLSPTSEEDSELLVKPLRKRPALSSTPSFTSSDSDAIEDKLLKFEIERSIQCLNKRSPSPTSEEDSELVLKPLRKRPALFSTTSYTSSDSDADENKLIESDERSNQCLNKRSPSPTSEEDSELLVKPLRKRPALFSTTSYTSSDSDADEDKFIESEDNRVSLNITFETNNNMADGENIDEMAILNGIIDSDSLSSWSNEDEDEESQENGKEGEKAKSKKQKMKYFKKEMDEKSEWKLDSLLTLRLDEKEEKEKKRDSISEEDLKTKSDSETTEIDDIFEVESTDSNSSDIQFVDLIVGGKSQELKGKGRKNIRAVLSEDTLQQSTIEAGKQEKEHIERLKEKRKNLEKIRESLKEAGLVLDATGETRIEVNPNLTKRLKPHQSDGVQFMWDACYETVDMIKTHPGAGCVLAHCMGLGKTFQVITLIHTLFKYTDVTKTRHVLVICPLSTVYNWQNEFSIAIDVAEEDTIEYVHAITDQQKSRASKIRVVDEWQKSGGILIMCYEAYVSFTYNSTSDSDKKTKLIDEALINPGPDLLVCDEGHQLKNANTQRSQMLSQIRTKRRIILTGTPIQNNLQEYYWMVHFVKRNLLGTHKEFMNRFANPIQNGQYDDSTVYDTRLMRMRSHVLHSILKNTVQRMEAKELTKYLPNKYDYVLFVKMHPVQAALYKCFLESFRSNSTERRLFSDFTALRPTWVHPYALFLKDQQKTMMKKKPAKNKQKAVKLGILNVEEEIEDPNEIPMGWWKDLTPEDYKTNLDYGPKLTIMLSIVKECEKVGDKLLIFTQFLLDLDLIENFLKLSDSSWQHGVNYYRMDGHVNMEMRERYCKRFNDKDSPFKIFMLTHKVGGLGLNLAAANRVILMDACWNPSYNEQSIFRVYRFGQDKVCYIYRLISMGTMEEVLYERSVTKQAVSNRVIDEMQVGRHYKSSELMSMYRCQVDVTEEPPIPKLPVDDVLARLLQTHKTEIYKYHEHQSLLENLEDEELDENEIKMAWENFNQEKENPPLPPPQHLAAQVQPGATTQAQHLPSTSKIMPPPIISRNSRLKYMPSIAHGPNPLMSNSGIKRTQQENETGSQDAFLNTIDLTRTNDSQVPARASVQHPSDNQKNNGIDARRGHLQQLKNGNIVLANTTRPGTNTNTAISSSKIRLLLQLPTTTVNHRPSTSTPISSTSVGHETQPNNANPAQRSLTNNSRDPRLAFSRGDNGQGASVGQRVTIAKAPLSASTGVVSASVSQISVVDADAVVAPVSSNSNNAGSTATDNLTQLENRVPIPVENTPLPKQDGVIEID